MSGVTDETRPDREPVDPPRQSCGCPPIAHRQRHLHPEACDAVERRPAVRRGLPVEARRSNLGPSPCGDPYCQCPDPCEPFGCRCPE